VKHLATITEREVTGSTALSTTPPRIAVNVVLFDADGAIALNCVGRLRFVTVPGGGVEAGEDLYRAVAREMWEEAGCECEILAELGRIDENRAAMDFTQERYYYIARVVGAKGELHLTPSERADNTTLKWRPLEQALQQIQSRVIDDYRAKFVQQRDIIALTAAVAWVRGRAVE